MKKATLSLVMIVKNEEKHLLDCIKAVSDITDEIIILDSGSTDKSLDIAQPLKAKIFHSGDWQGFGIQRQRAQSHAGCDYILALDADERITPDLKGSIVKILNKPVNDEIVYAVKRVNYFCKVPVHRHGWYFDEIVRLYSRTRFQYSDLEVHESVVTDGTRQETLDGYLLHYVCEDFHQFLDKNVRYSLDWATEKYNAGIESSLVKCLVNSMYSFFREYILRGAFLGGTYGFILAMGSAHYTFNKYLILLHKQTEK
jgi:glycosyltransferase involved in cell wall biosynthesis